MFVLRVGAKSEHVVDLQLKFRFYFFNEGVSALRFVFVNEAKKCFVNEKIRFVLVNYDRG